MQSSLINEMGEGTFDFFLCATKLPIKKIKYTLKICLIGL